jgi:hypothetical protein
VRLAFVSFFSPILFSILFFPSDSIYIFFFILFSKNLLKLSIYVSLSFSKRFKSFPSLLHFLQDSNVKIVSEYIVFYLKIPLPFLVFSIFYFLYFLRMHLIRKIIFINNLIFFPFMN